MFIAEITIADSRKTSVRLVKSEQKPKQHNYHLHIAIAPTKNMDRFEWFLEKATEIGIDEITPNYLRAFWEKSNKNQKMQ